MRTAILLLTLLFLSGCDKTPQNKNIIHSNSLYDVIKISDSVYYAIPNNINQVEKKPIKLSIE